MKNVIEHQDCSIQPLSRITFTPYGDQLNSYSEDLEDGMPMAEPAVQGAELLRPTPWICFRTWESAKGEWLSMISDERHHKIATLDGDSSRLWKTIEDGCSSAQLKEQADGLGVSNLLDGFLDMLVEQSFITKGTAEAAPVKAEMAPVPKQLENAENTKVEHEVISWVADQGFLFSAHWEVTYRCNERCVHCYNPGAAHMPHEKPERETDELTPAEALTLLDDLRAAGVFRLTLSGGEVMLRRDFWELVKGARDRGFSVNIYTNGLKLKDDACERLAALWPSTVSVSVYSAEAAAHDAITGVRGSFDRSVRSLELLRSRGVKTFLKSTQMGHTLGGYQRVTELAKRIGAGAEIDMMMSAAVDGAAAPLALAARSPEELVVLAATQGSPLFVGDATTGWGRIERDKDSTVCGAGVGAMGIDPTGGINTCNSMPLPAGSHRTHGFINIWKASRQYKRAHQDYEAPASVAAAVEPLSKWQSITLKDFHECGTHRRCGWCTKCPGLAMLEHGDPLAPSTTNCRLATARMTAVDILSQGLSRDAIAEKLGVPLDFGRRYARVIPIISEQQRGSGFDPQKVAASAMSSCATPSPLTQSSVSDKNGNMLLHRGTEATARAIVEFEGVAKRVTSA